jgi:hypothetical protein
MEFISLMVEPIAWIAELPSGAFPLQREPERRCRLPRNGWQVLRNDPDLPQRQLAPPAGLHLLGWHA